jgi:hypothetical protein
MPQPPQLAPLDMVETQVPLQFVSPPWHWHMPATQASPVLHAVPHFPQLATSVWTFTHKPPQASCPAVGQLHLPATQAWVLPQGRSHNPQ